MIVVLMLFLSTLAAAEQAAQAPSLPLDTVLQQVRERNPEIQAARSKWQAAGARVLSAETWKAPQVGVEYWGFSGASVGSAPEKWYDLSQDVPFPGKLHLRGQAAAHEARREEEVYKGVEQDVLARAKDAYYRYLFTQRAKHILDDNAEVMRRFARTTEAQYSTGKTSQSDVLRAQVELSKTLAALLRLDQERATAQAQLNALLSRAPDEPLGELREPSLAPLSFTEEDLERAALGDRPEVREASHHVNHMKASLAAERSEYLPDFSLQYSRRTRDGLPSDSIAMLKLSLPFLYFWRQRAEVRATSDELGHAESMLRSEQDQTRADVKQAWVDVQTAGRLVELYRTSILPQAEQSVKVSQTTYEANKIDFLNLLDSQRALLEFRIDYEQYVAKYGQDLAALERVLGVDLGSLKAGMPEEHHHDHE